MLQKVGVTIAKRKWDVKSTLQRRFYVQTPNCADLGIYLLRTQHVRSYVIFKAMCSHCSATRLPQKRLACLNNASFFLSEIAHFE